MSERSRLLLGDTLRIVAAGLLGVSSLAVTMHVLAGFPAPVWSRVTSAVLVGAFLAIASERMSPLFS